MTPIEAAIEDLKLQEVPQYRPTARKHGVDPCTLRRRFKGISLSIAEFHECQSLLSKEQQRVLIIEINRLSAFGTPPTVAMVRVFTSNIGGIWPGINWANRFIATYNNKLKSVYLKGFNLSRKKVDSWKELRKYYDLVFIPSILIYNY